MEVESFSLNFLDDPYFSSAIPKQIERQPIRISEANKTSSTATFSIQYNLMYKNRYERLAERFEGLHPCAVSRIQGTCLVSGVIKKKYKLQYKKIGSKKSAIPISVQQYVEPFIVYGSQDLVEIEDESGKIELFFGQVTKLHYTSEGNNLAKSIYKLQDLPFGVVVAIRGYLDMNIAKFVCEDVYFPQMPLQLPPISQMSIEEEESIILVASDLNGQAYETLITLLEKSYQTSPQIKTVVLCGTLYQDASLTDQKRYQHLDYYLEQLCNIVNLAIISDVSSPQWPHKPHPRFFLKKSYSYLLRCHNPSLIQLEELQILATNGQNITESMRVCPLTNPIDIMQSHLIYNHIAPYAPSTFRTVPLQEDTFVLDNVPQIYLVAKQNQFDSKLYKNGSNICRMVTVPPFKDGLVQINTRTLEASRVLLEDCN